MALAKRAREHSKGGEKLGRKGDSILEVGLSGVSDPGHWHDGVL